MNGASQYFVDFYDYTVPSGALTFISPGQVHRWHGVEKTAELLVIGFTPELFALDMLDVQKILINLTLLVERAAPIYPVPDEKKSLFQLHFSTALARVQEQPDHAETLIRAYLNLILVEAQNLIASNPAPALIPSAPLRLARRFRLDVERHYMERRQVREYADRLGVTTSHLVETVREITGSTPKRIMQDRLLLEAKRLLAYSSLSAAEIGHELSFPNSDQFGRWFKSNAGVAPGQFRHQLFM